MACTFTMNLFFINLLLWAVEARKAWEGHDSSRNETLLGPSDNSAENECLQFFSNRLLNWKVCVFITLAQGFLSRTEFSVCCKRMNLEHHLEQKIYNYPTRIIQTKLFILSEAQTLDWKATGRPMNVCIYEHTHTRTQLH